MEEDWRKNAFRDAPKSLYDLIKRSRFIGLLHSDYSGRKIKPVSWVIHCIRQIFDEKTVDDRTNAREGFPPIHLPEYILIWGFRQWGTDDLIQQGCWDLFLSAHIHAQKLLEIGMFVNFLDEVWMTRQLSFYLGCRTWCLERCVSIAVDHKDVAEYFTETFMTVGQIYSCLTFHFPQTEEEIIRDIIGRAVTFVDRTRTGEGEVANIPLTHVLELAVTEELDQRVRRLRKLFAFYRPVPGMGQKRFGLYLSRLSEITDEGVLDSLYRSGQVPNTIRHDIGIDTFSDYYGSGSRIVPNDWSGGVITPDEFCQFSQVYAMALQRWRKFEPFLNKIITAAKLDPMEEVGLMVNNVRYQTFQALQAKWSFDGVLLYQEYHRILETVVRTCLRIAVPQTLQFTKQIGHLEKLLEQKFDGVCGPEMLKQLQEMDKVDKAIERGEEEDSSELPVSAKEVRPPVKKRFDIVSSEKGIYAVEREEVVDSRTEERKVSQGYSRPSTQNRSISPERNGRIGSAPKIRRTGEAKDDRD
jgi:hypothetical protein